MKRDIECEIACKPYYKCTQKFADTVWLSFHRDAQRIFVAGEKFEGEHPKDPAH